MASTDLVPHRRPEPWPDRSDDLVADSSLPYYDAQDPPQRKIIGWRMSKLMRHGMPELSARLIAGRRDIDLHSVVDMLERGCPPCVVKEIVL